MNESRLLSNTRLAELCQQQNELFRREQTNDEQYCLELLRRAIFRLEGADLLVVAIYQPWLERKFAAWRPQLDAATLSDLSQEALARFFEYVTPEVWNRFSGLSYVLAYLIKCGETALIAHQRREQRQARIQVAFAEELSQRQRVGQTVEASIANAQVQQQTWECIRRNCNDPGDYLLAELLWLYGQKPRDIVKHYARYFPDITDVYKRKRNLLDRMKRDSYCRELFTLL